MRHFDSSDSSVTPAPERTKYYLCLVHAALHGTRATHTFEAVARLALGEEEEVTGRAGCDRIAPGGRTKVRTAQRASAGPGKRMHGRNMERSPPNEMGIDRAVPRMNALVAWSLLIASASCDALILETLARSGQTYAAGRRATGANERTFIPFSEPLPPEFQPLRIHFDVGRVRTDLADDALKLAFVESRILPAAREFVASMLSVRRPLRLVLRPDCLSWVSHGRLSLS